MCKNLRKHAVVISLGAVVVIIMTVMCTPALADGLQDILISVTPNFSGDGSGDPLGGSYGMELAAAHPAWRMAAVLPFVWVGIGLILLVGLLKVGLSIQSLVFGAILILLISNGVPIIWRLIP